MFIKSTLVFKNKGIVRPLAIVFLGTLLFLIMQYDQRLQFQKCVILMLTHLGDFGIKVCLP